MMTRESDTVARHARTGFSRASDAHGDVLTIGLINNMPDSALRATERQFCALLGAASEGRLIKLQFFSLPGIQRAAEARSHISRYYDDFFELERSRPDGLIVTGAEPQATTLQGEPYWEALARLIDWADEWAIPGIWSCLAAHAAVLRMDGIGRDRLDAKLSGLFECQINSTAHQILQGLPNRWRVPHSRLYGLSKSALVSSGYHILSQSSEAGPDIFVKRKRGLQLFFQGHPEYTQSTLLGEYRRDIARFLNGERNVYPEMPRHYCEGRTAIELEKLRVRACRVRDPDLLAEFDALVGGLSFGNPWFHGARQIYANWLSYLADSQARRLLHSERSTNRTGPIHLAA
jgi:homoserine O-succinyltransferase/O-acetyltransferase